MYEDLNKLEGASELLKDLKPLLQKELDEIASIYVDIPSDYLAFLSEYGAGKIDDGFHFVFLRTPLDAVSEVFKDSLILKHGVYGPVCIFGHDQGGRSFGFDLGDNGNILEIDEYRISKKINLSFIEFVTELLAGYPQLPEASNPVHSRIP